MGKHHRILESETTSYCGSGKERKRGQKVRAKEDAAQGVQVGVVTEVEPVGDDALDDETTGKSIESEQPGEFRYDSLRLLKPNLRL
jgi:hypothetical protein